MSFLRRGADCTERRVASAGGGVPVAGESTSDERGGDRVRSLPDVGRYLTDGVNLYRFLGAIPGAAGVMAGIENCRSLDIMLVPIDELQERSLRAIGGAGVAE
jgi:hypothetical protein